MPTRLLRVAAACLVATGVAGACGDDGTTAGPIGPDELAADAEVTAPVDTAATDGEAVPGTITGATAETVRCPAAATRIEVGADRFAEVDHPGADGARVGAVVLLHGYTGEPDAIRSTSGLTDAAAEAGVVVAYPEGRPVPDQVGYGWDAGTDVYSVPAGAGDEAGDDDVGAVLATVDALVADHCVDAGRIVLAGESNGGGMAVRVACDDRSHGRLAGVVPVIAAVGEATLEGCDPTDAVPLLAAAGTADVVVPFEGIDGTLLGQMVWFDHVAGAVNGCAPGSPGAVPEVGVVEVVEPEGCARPSRLAVAGGGTHRWPSGPGSGVDLGDWSLNELVLALTAD